MRLLFPAVALVVACMALLNGIMGDSLPNPSLFEATVQPVAAAGLLALCISVILGQSSSTKRIWHLIGAGLALLIVTVGLLELFDTIFGSGIGLTSRFFPNVSLAFGPAMAPNTAFCFVILGTASIFSRPPWSGVTKIISHRAIVVSQALACIASLIALLAIIGHIYHAGSFVAIYSARPMTMETAFCFAFLSISVLQIHLDRGVMRYVVTNGPGGYMARLLLPVSVLLPVGLGWLRIMGMRAQLFDAEVGIAFSTLLNVIMLFGLTLWAARKLFQMNEKTRQVEAELIYRATHDSLTGLVNRAVFRDLLLRRLKMIRNRRHAAFAVLYLDLDGFKQVNDFFGHDAGDQLLVEVGNILRKCIRVGDTVARFGGDEFVILCDEIESREDASQLAARIVAAMPSRFTEGEISVPIGISVGVAINPPNAIEISPDDLLREADKALYRAKTRGKGCYEMASA